MSAAFETQKQALPFKIQVTKSLKVLLKIADYGADIKISQNKLEFLYVLKHQRAFKKIKQFALVIYRGKLKVMIICMQ